MIISHNGKGYIISLDEEESQIVDWINKNMGVSFFEKYLTKFLDGRSRQMNFTSRVEMHEAFKSLDVAVQAQVMELLKVGK